jgi:hypothetical protein
MKLDLAFVFLFSLCISAVADAQSNPYGQLAVTQYAQPYMLLIRDEVVHDDLKLSTRQRGEVRELTDELDVSIWSMRNKSSDQVAKTMAASLSRAKSGMSTILTPEQVGRMDQIVMWTLGMKALARDSVAEKLGLRDDQRKEIEDTLTSTAKTIGELSQQLKSGTARASIEKKVGNLRNEEQRKILAALSRRQRQDLVTMLGRRIDLANLGQIRFKAPEIVGQGEWFNSQPLTLERLKGKVVALHFFAFA